MSATSPTEESFLQPLTADTFRILYVTNDTDDGDSQRIFIAAVILMIIVVVVVVMIVHPCPPNICVRQIVNGQYQQCQVRCRISVTS